jgi:hypothetical protein
LEDRMVGADVVAEPNGLAGDAVPSGAVTGAAETVPGTVHPPYSPLAFSAMKEESTGIHTSLGSVFTYIGVQP